ncbi:FMN-dependent dehydrogenase-domain-containing protein [Lentinula guzmanii]|uniref:FMN-dependent dehydrogenase-domain-containing protein n=1 Tax=Lentinula guzmanii TaxID=2804957 RepID=A0AA38MR47_9AGAR|nr:FMN-dependent dehydrogenase-domain-containing protein [Lentinula guzmanii]
MAWTTNEIAKHKDASSCWVIIKDEVYDVTEFLLKHPGGPGIILKYAGHDATSAFVPIHSPDAIQRNLSPSQCLGRLADTKGGEVDVQMGHTQDEMRVEREMKRRPPLNQILNLTDIENVAKKVLPHPVLAFYSAGTDDEVLPIPQSLARNRRAFDRFFFHPRVMRPVSICDPSTKILGYHSSLPIFVSGAAQAILGELNITRACGKANIIQMVCTTDSAAALPSQPLFFQLYKVTDTAASTKVVQEAEQLGYKAIALTVDAVVVGNRERDVKSLWVLEQQEGKTQVYFEWDPEATTNLFGSSAVNRRNAFDSDLSWKETIPWLRSITKLPIILKGIQCVEDAMLAVEAGVEAILVSNHGGMVFSLPPLEVLHRIRQQQPDIFDKLEGGIRRGTDVIKAVCLGSKAVGLGRPFLYALSAYGEAGVTKMLDVLHREITISMRLLGAASIRDLTPEMVERVDWEPVRQRNTKL